MSIDITHDAAGRRFVSTVDGHTSAIDYALDAGVMTILHTNVPQAVGGRGIAGELTRCALDTARGKQWTVIPQCSYVRAFIDKHTEYQDLLAVGH